MLTVYRIDNKNDTDKFHTLLKCVRSVPREAVVLAIVEEGQNDDFLGGIKAKNIASEFKAANIIKMQSNGNTYHYIYSYEANIKVWVKDFYFKARRLFEENPFKRK